MAQEGGGEWYQSIIFNKLSCRQVSIFGPKGTPSREEHKTSSSVLTTFCRTSTNWCRKIGQNVSPVGTFLYQSSQRMCTYGITLQRIATRSIIQFFYFTALQNLTKDGIAFPRHATPIVKCFRRRCAYGDTLCTLIFATWSITSLADFSLTILMDFLKFVLAPDGDELIIICEDTGRVNRLPLQSSKLLPHPLTRKPVVPPSPPGVLTHWLWTRRKFL